MKIKRLYTYVLQSFLPLFLMTFGICLFIVLMQFVWRYIDDMVGKGFGIAVLGEMLLYAAVTLVPMALPLAVLLASLMAFGNLGERFELLAMKSAGVSLIHIMRPLIIFIAFVSVGAFFFQNNVMPVAQVKLYTLLYSMRQKSPELDIPQGAFYTEIKGYNVYVRTKDNNTGLLRDVMIYDYSNGFNNARVIVADSGRLKTSEDKMFLVLSLFDGESFKNLTDQPTGTQASKEAVPYQRETFETRDILIEFDANFSRTDESFMQNQYLGKNLHDLQVSIDSMTVRLDSINNVNARNIVDYSYQKSFSEKYRKDQFQSETHTESDETETESVPIQSERKTETKKPTLVLNFDSLYLAEAPAQKATILTRAKNSVESSKSEYMFRANTIAAEGNKVRRHYTEWHTKFTICFACLVFFFIGAPLGAIIRKGGLGTPVVISVFLFIFYYIINNIGFKMARDGVWPAWQGMWLSSAVLSPLGIFLTYKAVNDSVILNAETYINALKNLIGKRPGRKVEQKEVIMFYPNYEETKQQLEVLANDCSSYLSTHKRWLNYFRYWKKGGKDPAAEQIARQTETIAEELGNSDKILILNKLMDFPIIGGYNQLNANLNYKLGFAIGLFFPLGIPVYLIAVYQRKLLRQDVRAVQKTSTELIDLINEL